MRTLLSITKALSEESRLRALNAVKEGDPQLAEDAPGRCGPTEATE